MTLTILLFFNYLLKQGVLNQAWGAPALLILVLLVVLGAFALFARHIPTLARSRD